MIALIVCLINCWCLLLTGEGFIKSADAAFGAIIIEIVIESFGGIIFFAYLMCKEENLK